MTRIALGRVLISDRQIELVNLCLAARRLSSGPMIREYETLLSSLYGCKQAIAMASGTCSLQVVLEAAKELYGWPDGAEVIVPALTFIATVSAVRDAGLKPVLCDVDANGNLDIDCFWDSRQPTGWSNIEAILPVHMLGRSANMTRIVERAKQAGVAIIEDCCETAGVSHSGKACGSFGLGGAISTYVCHHVSTGIGGAVVTNDDNLATICRSLMVHGRDPMYLSMDDDDGLDDAQLASMMRTRYSFVRWGHSYRISELEAAIGVGAIENTAIFEADKQSRRIVAHEIGMALSPWSDRIAEQSWDDGANPLFYPLICDTPETCAGLSEAFERAGIETRPYMPLLNQPIILQMLAEQRRSPEDFPIALGLCQCAFLVGCHPGLEKPDVDYIRVTTQRYFAGETQ